MEISILSKLAVKCLYEDGARGWPSKNKARKGKKLWSRTIEY
jgi:hypothetical protein